MNVLTRTAGILIFLVTLAYGQAGDVSVSGECPEPCAPFPGPGSFSPSPSTAANGSLISANIQTSPNTVLLPSTVVESITGAVFSLDLTGGLGNGGTRFIRLTATNAGNRNWTAFEIELRVRPNDPSGEDGLSFGKIFMSPDNPFLGYDLVIPSPLTGSDCAAARTFPCSDRFNKLTLVRYHEPVTGQTWLKDILRFSSGSVRPGQSVSFTFLISQLDALNPNFHIIQRPNPGPSTQ